MADEPRRSVRATKGQHTKSLDVLDAEPVPKKKGGKKGKKAVEEPEEEIIRCICGVTESSEDDPEAWIACDSCNAWQHNVCMGVSPFSEDVPKTYFCEQCRPNLPFHKELLEGIKRGEKVWEDRRAKFEKQQRDELEAEQDGPKKGRKKGKRTSDPKVDLVANGKAKSSTPVPAAEKKKEKTTSAKRNRDESHDNLTKEPNKVRKVSAAHTTPRQDSPPQTGLTTKIIDLETLRQGGAKLVQKGLLHSIPVAIKSGIFVLSKGDTVDLKAERLAIQVEQAVHSTHPDKNAYLKQSRALSSNLKQNQELCNGLLSRSLSPEALAVMSTDDMASKELKRETAEMKARADKQSIMITDDGPRIRRTHKGDEMIEGDNFAVPNDSTMSTSRRRSMLDPNGDMAVRSRENSPGDQVELPADIDEYRSRDDIRSHALPKQPLNVDTKQTPVRKQSSASNFDINKVFQSVQSPTEAQHIPRRVSTQNAPPANGPGVDPEIDKLLQDDGNDSPPYSPAEYDSDPEIIWRGVVNMDPVARFPAVAKHIAGADMSRTMPWSEILTKELKIAGRIQSDRANEYLCSLRYSPQTDVVVVNVTPTGESALQGFTELYEYFQTKDRYGVLANKAVGNIRDTYLVPVPPNPGKLPDFVTNLEGYKIPEVRSEPMIIVALVIRHELPQPQALQPFDGSASPSIPTHPHQRQMSISGTGPQMSPIGPPQGPFPGAQPSGPPPNHYNLPSQVSQSQQDIDQRRGEENANRILGEYATSPTVSFLMPQAWQMREVEWEIIRRILEEDAKARTDLAWLNYMLEKRLSGKD